MRILRESSEDEMIACFLKGELSSERFGTAIRDALAADRQPEELLTLPNLADRQAHDARRSLLAMTRGYGENRELFDEDFPTRVHWVWARLGQDELARVRYMDYSYWIELSGGSRLPSDAARRITAGARAFGVTNRGALDAAEAVRRGERFPPLILVGRRHDDLVCLEGHLRLTGYALAGFPVEVECLIGSAPTMGRWAH
jgi:hypothetical protein